MKGEKVGALQKKGKKNSTFHQEGLAKIKTCK